MALHPDLSDPALFDAFEDVRNENSPTNWVIFGYVPKSEKIKVEETGTGDLTEMLDNMSDGKVHYCFMRFKVNSVYKFVYIAWCGEGVAGLRKGSFASHSVDMGKLLHGYHVQINARSESDVDEKDILSRLARATGSHGRQSDKARFQGTASQNATPGSVSASQAAITSDRSFGGRKQEPLISKEESEAYWNKQRQIDETTKQENAYVPQRAAPEYSASANAAGLKDKFSNPSSFDRPVERTAPSIPAAAPAPAPTYHEPEPEPEPVHHYEEPAPAYHEEPAASYEEPAYHEEPAAETYDESGGYQEEAGGYQDGGYDQSGSYQEEAAPAGTGIQCRALYDYAGENEGDLSFSEGEIIDILDQSDPSGWWQGTAHGATGFFPSNFVEQI